eukprot:9654870-Karenia_brevis.AAC.1
MTSWTFVCLALLKDSEKQRSLSLVEQLKGNFFILQEDDEQLRLLWTEASKAIIAWTSQCYTLE